VTEDAHPQHSGSRWEPTGPAPSEAETETVSDEYAGPDAGFRPAAAVAGSRTPLRRRIPVAIAGLAVAVAGGLGGFAIGQAAAGSDDSPAGVTAPQDDGRPGGDRHGFDGRIGPDGQLPGDDDGTGTDGT
jgi:hypothetical protein